MLAVLAAVDTNGGATLVQLVARTGIDKQSVIALIAQATVQAGVKVSKTGPTYRLDEWGPAINRRGARMALTGELRIPPEEWDESLTGRYTVDEWV